MSPTSQSQQAKLQSLLRRTLKSLDQAIANVSPLESNLQRALKNLYVHRDDELGRLLAEVAQKAGLLDSARMRAAYISQHGENVAMGSYAAEIHLKTSRVSVEPYTPLDVDLPQPIRHGDVVIGVDALAASPTRYQLQFHLDSDIPFERTLPLLSGVSVSDQTTNAYQIVAGQEANTADGADSRLFGTIEFAPNPRLRPDIITFAVACVLFADRQSFIATEAPARLVEGPWEFTLTIR